LNAFFTAFELSREEKNRYEFESLGPIPNFQQADFCFAFRAREYVRSANEKLFNNSFANLAERLNKMVYQEYEATFLKKKSIIQEEKISNTIDLGDNKVQNLFLQLKSENPKDILSALDVIEKEMIIAALDPLEYLLNCNNDIIQERALEVIMKLKGEEL
jgi:hypothetical protein